jgi:hypothetical protein
MFICSGLLFSMRKPVAVDTFCPLSVRRSLHQSMVLPSLVVDFDGTVLLLCVKVIVM